jgi:hypothetical protein
MTAKFVSKKTALIAIIAAGAASAIVAAIVLSPLPAIAEFGPRFSMHGGPGNHGGGPFGHGGWYGDVEANWTGSVPLQSVRSDIIESVKTMANVSIADAASAAEQSIGDDGRVFSVSLAPSNGYLVYTAFGIDSSNNVHRVIVDAGNGEVLDSAQVDMEGHWAAHKVGMWRQ